MSPRLAWLLPAATVLLVCFMLPLSWATAEHDGAEVLFGLAFVAYAIVGALIASRQPRNPVGWLFAALGLLSAFTETLYTYATREVERSGGASGTVTAAAWVSEWAGQPSFVALVPLLLLFPTGRFLSQRWRLVGTSSVALAALWAVASALNPGPLLDLSAVTNPMGIDAADAVLGFVTSVAPVIFFLLVPVGVASVVVRYRLARAEERQQIKWLAMAGGFAIAMIMTVAVLGLFTNTDRGIGDLLTALLVAAAITAFPVAAAIAILRHRLYDIDLVIKRTLVYGALTVTLVVAYLGSVLAFRLLIDPVTGESDLAVAASTLAVAAMFRPLRARIQSVVDRRFYRERYNAALTLEGFAGRLRHELDVDSLGTDLRAVVHDTMQPAHVSLWLRRAPR